MSKGDKIRCYLQSNRWSIVWAFGDYVYAVPKGYICYDYEIQSIGFYYNMQVDLDFLIPNIEDEVLMGMASEICYKYNNGDIDK